MKNNNYYYVIQYILNALLESEHRYIFIATILL